MTEKWGEIAKAELPRVAHQKFITYLYYYHYDNARFIHIIVWVKKKQKKNNKHNSKQIEKHGVEQEEEHEEEQEVAALSARVNMTNMD